MAVRDDADIVIGKVVGHGKSVPRNLFRRNRTGVDLRWEPLLWLLTPHKLFRRASSTSTGCASPRAAGGWRTTCSSCAPTSRRRASPCSPTTPVTTGSCATATPTRRAAARPRVVLRERARGARHRRRAHRARGVPRPAVLALVPGQDAQPRRDGALQPGPRPPAARSTRRCTSWPSSASPSASTRCCRSTCSCARVCCARAPTTRSRRSRSSRRAARARRARSPCGRARAASSCEVEAELGPAFRRDGERVAWSVDDADATPRRREHRAGAAQAARDAGGVPRAGRGRAAARGRARWRCGRPPSSKGSVDGSEGAGPARRCSPAPGPCS